MEYKVHMPTMPTFQYISKILKSCILQTDYQKYYDSSEMILF